MAQLHSVSSPLFVVRQHDHGLQQTHSRTTYRAPRNRC